MIRASCTGYMIKASRIKARLISMLTVLNFLNVVSMVKCMSGFYLIVFPGVVFLYDIFHFF
jgi:hypothetical protein